MLYIIRHQKKSVNEVNYASVFQLIISKKQSKCKSLKELAYNMTLRITGFKGQEALWQTLTVAVWLVARCQMKLQWKRRQLGALLSIGDLRDSVIGLQQPESFAFFLLYVN